ncbi:hypothetical protein CVT27_19675 [Streptomyces cavourensis]|nr:hypothetical protein CVT27_19675 [Streptomyces cavourensis]
MGGPNRPVPQPPAAGEPPADRLPRHLLLGFLCTAGNPKVGLFLTVFLPQFPPVEAPSAAALSLLALVYLAIGALRLLVLTEVGVRVVARRTAGGAAFPRSPPGSATPSRGSSSWASPSPCSSADRPHGDGWPGVRPQVRPPPDGSSDTAGTRPAGPRPPTRTAPGAGR